MASSLENHWIQRIKTLTQVLIISGTLNIGLVATFVYFVLKDKHESLAIELKPASKDSLTPGFTNEQLLRAYSLLPFQELILRLENKELVEEGLTKRDLSLACLTVFHHFNLEKALSNQSLQKRHILMQNAEGQEVINVAVFPGLTDSQFQAVVEYARTEKWPLTAQGLYYELQRSPAPRDPALLETFYLTPEFRIARTLFAKTGIVLSSDQLIDLLCEGSWDNLATLVSEQKQALDLSPERRRTFLLSYLNHHSIQAATLLLETDLEFLLKRLDDQQILAIFDILHERTPELEKFSKDLLSSPRTDAVWQKAASLLYSFQGETLPQPYNHTEALARFVPEVLPPKVAEEAISTVKTAIVAAAPKKKLHTIEAGENLWKIARKYHVSIEEIKRVNNLDTEKLKPGKQLEIPEKS